ncbi:MAG: hypothetical protein D6B28_03685 [Gammaproteobacteria bacterium]|nr:MAG: hypothetical protein D6B28_03685 [Gammaproteobacteria bacterium]
MKNLVIATAGLLATLSTPIIANATCTEHTSSNSAHVSAGRAYVCSAWYACATGSNENLGLNNSFTTTTLKEEGGVFSKGTCPIVTGEAPEVGSWALVLDEPHYTPDMIDVVDVDGDLQTLQVKVTNSRNDDVDMLNCAFSLKDGSLTEYRGSSCDTYVAPQWGTYTFTPIATDAQGNASEGHPSTQNATIGSAAPTIAMTSYYLDGTVLKVAGTATDADDDVAKIILGVMPVFGIECEGTTDWTCTVETTEYFEPGQIIGFDVYARDSVENMSNMESFQIEIPEASNPPVCATAKNADHVAAGRAYMMYGVLVYAEGSGDYLGTSTMTTSIEQQIQPGNWVKVPSCN